MQTGGGGVQENIDCHGQLWCIITQSAADPSLQTGCKLFVSPLESLGGHPWVH